jgi:hypothetical protein
LPAAKFDREKHWHVVADAFTKGTGQTRRDLRVLLTLGGATCWVQEGIAPVLIDGVPRTLVNGFVVVKYPQQVVWAWTRAEVRKQGLMTALLTAAGLDTTRGFEMVSRTPASDRVVRRLARRGWPVRFPDLEYVSAIDHDAGVLTLDHRPNPDNPTEDPA